MENHWSLWNWVQERAMFRSNSNAFLNQHWCTVSSVHFLWRHRELWWPMDTDQLSLLLFHLSICLYLAYRRLLCSLFFFTGSCLGLQHNQTLHPCFIFNDSACAQTNSTLKHSWVEDVMQLTLVDLAAGYSLSPCAYLPKPGGDSMQLMHTEAQRANMWRFAKWHTPLPLPSAGRVGRANLVSRRGHWFLRIR